MSSPSLSSTRLVNDLSSVQVSGQLTSANSQQNFQDLLGETTCTNALVPRTVYLFSLAIMATFVYIFFQLPPVEEWFVRYIPDYTYRFIGKALLFFVIIYFCDRFVVFIRHEIAICEF